MNTLRKLVLFFSIIAVAATPICAKIGDTEEQVLNEAKEHGAEVKATDKLDNGRVTILVFNGNGLEYAVGILDGKAEVESLRHLDNTKLTTHEVITTLSQYTEDWTPISVNNDEKNDRRAMISQDGEIIAVYGKSKDVKSDHLLMVFSKTWHEYAKEYMLTHQKL